ncbi:hybrid sensor histidine kinase/response regulator [Leptolyngbya sp. FACHB-261]|uniref:hybrid sensor histidine kinase/response regulator n=1 Tax=Leptolyngbya sp. FACHB-261 TaxID=2692806 RepID=UPI0016832844|nr:hybrid sensor histidine kinase/response regulator [Leptolyngbya sp. FACHB-261]MBD2102433.1 response regulator [Leptolyngbya sp. FACHB-261]
MQTRIMIVEDEIIIARDIQRSLKKLGYSAPVIAGSGEKAIEKATETNPDLILMDIILKGGMNGIEAAQQIYSDLNIPIVYLTANADENTLQRAKETGPFGYILKPFEERELHTTIQMALERHKLEKQLKEREQWLETILNSVSDAVIVTDMAGKIKFVNPVAEVMTGWGTDALDRDLADIIHIIQEQTRTPVQSPNPGALQGLANLYLVADLLLISKAGTELPIDLSAAPLKDHQGNTTGTVLVFRDLTERRQSEASHFAVEQARQLEAQMAELRRLDQLKDEFLNTVSHELRTPLSVIKMAIQMLEISLNQRGTTAASGPESDPTARYLQILREQCDQEMHLVNDLLDLQRLNADAEPLIPATIYLEDWLPEFVETFRERASSDQQNLQVQIPPDIPAIVSDASCLQRALRELLHNACKYTPPNGQINVEVSAAAQQVQIRVCNTGPEIPASELPRLFDKFYRVPGGDPRGKGGTGLGLALVQKLVFFIGGTINVESNAGETCFTIELPLDRTSSD